MLSKKAPADRLMILTYLKIYALQTSGLTYIYRMPLTHTIQEIPLKQSHLTTRKGGTMS